MKWTRKPEQRPGRLWLLNAVEPLMGRVRTCKNRSTLFLVNCVSHVVFFVWFVYHSIIGTSLCLTKYELFRGFVLEIKFGTCCGMCVSFCNIYRVMGVLWSIQSDRRTRCVWSAFCVMLCVSARWFEPLVTFVLSQLISRVFSQHPRIQRMLPLVATARRSLPGGPEYDGALRWIRVLVDHGTGRILFFWKFS